MHEQLLTEKYIPPYSIQKTNNFIVKRGRGVYISSFAAKSKIVQIIMLFFAGNVKEKKI